MRQLKHEAEMRDRNSSPLIFIERKHFWQTILNDLGSLYRAFSGGFGRNCSNYLENHARDRVANKLVQNAVSAFKKLRGLAIKEISHGEICSQNRSHPPLQTTAP